MKPYGKISIGTIIFIAVIGVGLWLVISLAPAYLDNFDVDEAVIAAVNQAGNGASDEKLRNHIIAVSRRTGTHRGEDDAGSVTDLPGLGITEENITIERNEQNNDILVRVDYERLMQLKPLGRFVRLTFSPQRTGKFRR